MRVLKYFWTCLLQACSYQAVFHNYLNGLCSPSLVISLGLLSLSWSSFPLLWRILICILIIKVKLKASSDSSLTLSPFHWLHCLEYFCSQQNGAGCLSRGHLFLKTIDSFLSPWNVYGLTSCCLKQDHLYPTEQHCSPIFPQGWRGCRCLFWLWPIVTMIYPWALVPGLTLAPVQSPAWCSKSFLLMLVCMKGTEL